MESLIHFAGSLATLVEVEIMIIALVFSCAPYSSLGFLAIIRSDSRTSSHVFLLAVMVQGLPECITFDSVVGLG